jgi:hypothetical protein
MKCDYEKQCWSLIIDGVCNQKECECFQESPVLSDLKLVQRKTPRSFDFCGFTVQYGNFFGSANWNGEKVPVFWSGWTSANCIFLYNVRTKFGYWVDGEDVDGFTVLTDETWEEETDSGCVPWFAA